MTSIKSIKNFVDRFIFFEVRAQRFLAINFTWLGPFSVFIHHSCREVGLGIVLTAMLLFGAWRWTSRTVFLMSFGELVNGAIKFATVMPRPAWTHKVVLRAGPWEPDYSFPSSHSQVMLGFSISICWTLGFFHPVSLVSLCVAVAAGLSRAFLGQHFFHDIAAGWIVETAIAIPSLALFDRVVSSTALCLVCSCAFLAWPALLEFIKRIVPDHPNHQIRLWEEFARGRSGVAGIHINPRQSHVYIQQACSCAAVLLAFLLARMAGWEPVFDSTCTSHGISHMLLVFTLRLVFGAPALMWPAFQQGFADLGPKNALLLFSFMWGMCLCFVFIEFVLGVRCT